MNKMSEEQRENLEKAKQEAIRESRLFTNLFSSLEGERVLEILKEEFYYEPICLPGATQRDDSVRAAQVDVITFIELNIRRGKEE